MVFHAGSSCVRGSDSLWTLCITLIIEKNGCIIFVVKSYNNIIFLNLFCSQINDIYFWRLHQNSITLNLAYEILQLSQNENKFNI